MDTSSISSREEAIRFIDETNQKLWQTRGIPDWDPVEITQKIYAKSIEINYK